jgi:predicted DNA-binding protein YlxM (UPF0122 family)
VISMEMMGKIRRMYFLDKLSLHEITKRTGLARNTIRKWIRAPEAAPPTYQRRAVFNKLSPFHASLVPALKADSLRAKQNRRGQCQGAVCANQNRGLRRWLQPAHRVYPCLARGERQSARLCAADVCAR